jgi:hypothetical protein
MCKDMERKQTWVEAMRQKDASRPRFQTIRAGRKHYGKPRGILQTYDKKLGFAAVQRSSELMTKTLPRQKWAVEGLIPEGYAVLAGGKSVGKSWLALNLALAVAMGEKALGTIPTEQGTVLYLSLEDDERMVQERVGMLLGERAAPYELALVYAEPDLGNTLLEKLETWLAENHDTRLVLIDLYAKVKPPSKGHKDRYQEEYEFADSLQTLAQEANVPIVLLTHTNQQSEEQLDDTFHGIGGTNGLLAPARAMLKLSRKRFQRTMTLRVSGKGIKEQEYTLQPDEQWRIILKDEPPKASLSMERQQIIDVLTGATRGYTPAEVAKKIGKDDNNVRQLMNKMLANAQLSKDNEGGYWVVKQDMSL